MKNCIPHLTTAGLALVLGLASVSAQSISITNFSFESNTGYNGGSVASPALTGWTTGWPVPLGQNSQPGSYGDVSNVTGSFTSGLTGTNAIFLNGPITQLTAATFTAGVTYTLQIDVGNPNTVAANTSGLSFGFRNAANDGFIAGTGNQFISSTSINAIADGTFQNFSVAYTAVAADAGNAIRIGMTDFTHGSLASYRIDNVRFSASAIPEPSTYASLAGLGVLGLAALRRRRAV